MSRETLNLNGNVLAFVGDAVMSLQVREYLVAQGMTRSKKLQETSVKYVSAKAQSAFVLYLLEQGYLDDEELLVFKRGRNYKSESSAKNADIITYRQATGLEALWGYWYLTRNEKRLQEMFELLIAFVSLD